MAAQIWLFRQTWHNQTHIARLTHKHLHMYFSRIRMMTQYPRWRRTLFLVHVWRKALPGSIPCQDELPGKLRPRRELTRWDHQTWRTLPLVPQDRDSISKRSSLRIVFCSLDHNFLSSFLLSFLFLLADLITNFYYRTQRVDGALSENVPKILKIHHQVRTTKTGAN